MEGGLEQGEECDGYWYVLFTFKLADTVIPLSRVLLVFNKYVFKLNTMSICRTHSSLTQPLYLQYVITYAVTCQQSPKEFVLNQRILTAPLVVLRYQYRALFRFAFGLPNKKLYTDDLAHYVDAKKQTTSSKQTNSSHFPCIRFVEHFTWTPVCSSQEAHRDSTRLCFC